MEKIPLRAYNREIERLIDENRSEEALEHCQRILEKYPRCLETYRLMGKAHLELREYDKSENAFKQVLSFVPDDFIANLGMSLLREKQTNLEGTIWHMERAFESQSSNTAIQNELRRLYKQRDGVDAPRVHLTRGSLIRMYMRGDMLPQAINEIQSILAEDPSRMDIKILKAEALLMAGRKDEALEICEKILVELPYCYPANRLLFENRSTSTKIEEAQVIQLRLRELDPYYEYTSPTQPDPDAVKEDEVFIEVPEGLGLKTATASAKLEHSSSFNAFRQATENQIPSSASKAGWQMEQEYAGEKFEEQKPSWMENLPAPSFEVEQFTGNSSGSMPANPNTGFTSGKLMTTNDNPNEYPLGDENSQYPASDDSSSAPNPFLAVPGDSIPAAEPGDIPEWLKALASEPPAASSDAITAPLRVPGETGVLQTGEENLEFLRNLQGEGSAPQAVEEPPASEFISPSSPVEILPGLLPESPFVPTGESTQPVPIESGEEAKSVTPPQKEMPNWMRTAAETSEEPPSNQQPVEDFRQDFIPEKPTQTDTYSESTALENQYQSPQSEFEEAATETGEVPSGEIEQYLEQLRKDTSTGEQPDWLKKENLGSDIEALFDENKKPEEISPEPEGAPDWMVQLREENEAHPEPASSTTPMSVPNVPDWLFTPEETGGDTAPIQSETPVTHQPPPDWLTAARPDVFAQDLKAEEEGKLEPESSSSVSDEASRLDFLTGQAEAPSSESSTSEEQPPSEERPDLSFLESQPVDFMSADRAPLTDNLVMPEEEAEQEEVMDFSKATAAESLPADLAAMLREEADSPFTTNPLVAESTPEISNNQIAGLSQAVSFDEFRTVEPEKEEIVPEVPTPEASVPEAAQPEVTQPEAQITIPEKPAEPEVEAPPEALPSMDFFVSPLEEAAPTETVKPSSEGPTVEEIIEAVTPKAKEPEHIEVSQFSEAEMPVASVKPEPIEEVEPAPVVKRPIDEKTVPVSSVVPPVQPVETPSEVKTPEITESVPLQQAKIEEAVVPPPTKVEEAVVPPPAKVQTPTPQPVKPVEISKPVETKPAQPPRVSKPSKPAPPKKTQSETTRSVSTSKKVGMADLTRARESVNKGDLSTALRRYVKLINANKAIDEVSGDLKDLVRKHPKEYLVWQTYGDARLRANRIQEALDAYAKAADLLK